MQGHTRPLHLELGGRKLTDGAGLLLVRRLWDRLGAGRWLDAPTRALPGHARLSLMVEVWTGLLLYGGGWMDDLRWFQRRGVRRLFGWQAVPNAVTLVAFLQESGDLAGIRWRAGSASTATGAKDWTGELIARLREAGVEDITVRLDKGFFSRELPTLLDELGVAFLLKVPNHAWLRDHRGSWRRSERAGGALAEAHEVWTATGTLWGFRLFALQGRRPLPSEEGAVVEQRIKELGQLSVGQTAVDDLDGNRLLWALGALAY